MRRLRLLILALLLVGALGQMATLRAQEDPAQQDESDNTIYLPAIVQGGAQQTDDGMIVRLHYRSPEELETFLADLDVLEARCGAACVLALVSPAQYQHLLAEGRRFSFAGLFVLPHTSIATPLVESLGCALEQGPTGRYVKVDARQQTSVAGVFACGDVARPAGTLPFAAADGTLAGVAAHQSLIFDGLA